MKKVVLVLAILTTLIVLTGIAVSQSEVEKAKSDLALAEAKERIVVYRVVEEEVRLKVSIIENQIRLAQLTKALTPVDPNLAIPPMADPNN